ncbi:EF-hand domain-containing protein [Salipiger mucosus]|uniref:EF-hand domain-containing protein n=1 Tax=Salipiger mucosus DSM 16094 TaxID=1123237 RepID=S9R4I6_9RHOB|nr:EF-hand domain-containing protein [Salipiger mucosus]EPX86837.1 hypothetical protein Salmuc_01487 [Salipiger mucosus DSM 16094]
MRTLRKTCLTTTTVLAMGAAVPALAATDTQSGETDMSPSSQTQTMLCDQGQAQFDMNDDGLISDKEIKQASERSFKKMDENGDGIVQQAEFLDCMNAGAGTQSAQSDRGADNMGQYDTDGNGELSREEFMNAGAEARDSGSEADLGRLTFDKQAFGLDGWDGASAEDMATQNAAMFDSLDSDSSGSLSEEEWSVEQAEIPDMRDTLGRDFEAADADNSGDLNQSEYTRMNAMKADRAAEAAEPQSGSDEQSADATDKTGAPVFWFYVM